MSFDLVLAELGGFSNRPYDFVMWAFPWGEPGSELEESTGPEGWQRDVLMHMQENLQSGMAFHEAVQIAICSGHGVGKSALVSWIIIWAISTFEDTRGVVTANTETQLKTKTWAELGKWYRLFIAKEMFKLTATAIYSVDEAHERTWRVDMVPWSERTVEAFAGMHNKHKRVLVIFDEASAILDMIWETTEGALTDSDTQIFWIVCGNPTRNTGRFRDCFGRYANRWKGFRVDSRLVSITNKLQIAKWIEDYGEDSDFVRVRVRGVFPRAGSLQFIASDLVLVARSREVSVHLHDPFIIGVDVARFGDDSSVIYFRKGRDGRTFAPIKLHGVDTMTLAAKVVEERARYKADAVFVDGTGVGGGVVDRLRQLRVSCFDVQFGSSADRVGEEGTRYKNKRAEMWGFMRDWLKGGAIPDDPELEQQLIGLEYGYAGDEMAIQLERKKDMKKRLGFSPDIADALALTFAYPVVATAQAGGPHSGNLVKSDYDPYSEMAMAS